METMDLRVSALEAAIAELLLAAVREDNQRIILTAYEALKARSTRGSDRAASEAIKLFRLTGLD
jgi:hypothetical protein